MISKLEYYYWKRQIMDFLANSILAVFMIVAYMLTAVVYICIFRPTLVIIFLLAIILGLSFLRL